MRRGYVIGILLCFFVVGMLYTAGFHWMEDGKQHNSRDEGLVVQETEGMTVMAAEAVPEETVPDIFAQSGMEDTGACLALPDAGMYCLKEQDGRVWVYRSDRTTLFEKTEIPVDSLPEILRVEIRNGKMLRTEQELYSFLENYSS